MAERRPLVLVSGRVQELPAGDTTPGAGATDYPMIKASVPAATTVTIPTGYHMIAGPDFIVDGDLQIDGDFIMVG